MENKKKAKGTQQENLANIRKAQQNHRMKTIGTPQQNPNHQATGKVQESSGETKGKHRKSNGQPRKKNRKCIKNILVQNSSETSACTNSKRVAI